MKDDVKGPSTAQFPDLDWSQVRETVRMLHLTVAQIEMAMRDGDDSIGALTSSFTAMVDSVERIRHSAEALPEGPADTRGAILGECAGVSGRMHEAIVAFQFYDKLSQRLTHVAQGLEGLAGLVADQARLYNPQEWRNLQGMIRSRYSMREEQAMFDALLAGAGIQEALALLEQERCAVGGAEADVELF